MPYAGQVLDNGWTRMEFVVTAADSARELHEMRVTYAPNSPFPPPHLHPAQDEHFEILQGSVLFVVDGVERTLGTGEHIEIPRGTVHQPRIPPGRQRS
jgi:mannose-6-phosphate isomerase-like protein (cupin superfamily)